MNRALGMLLTQTDSSVQRSDSDPASALSAKNHEVWRAEELEWNGSELVRGGDVQKICQTSLDLARQLAARKAPAKETEKRNRRHVLLSANPRRPLVCEVRHILCA